MFTVEQRDALRDRLLALAEDDPRTVAGAAVGSLAVGSGDRYSDLDLTFAVVEGEAVADVLADWTRMLVDELDAVRLVDLGRPPTIYRVFLLPDALQFDLSLTPAGRFRPGGPRFQLLFGDVAPPADDAQAEPAVGDVFIATPATAADLFGWGVVYALHARACVERGRLWQAEHYVGAVRDHGLSLACLNAGLVAVQARGFDDLPPQVLARFADAHVGVLEPEALRGALAGAVRALVRGGEEARLTHAKTVTLRLAELC